jgi:hypothetical protein
MQIYEVTAPDGKTITLQGPFGASNDEIIRQAKALYKPQPGPWDDYGASWRLVPLSAHAKDETAGSGDWFAANAPKSWHFTVHKKVNKLKLTGLVVASIAVTALAIQGLISVFAWVGRGFRA